MKPSRRRVRRLPLIALMLLGLAPVVASAQSIKVGADPVRGDTESTRRDDT